MATWMDRAHEERHLLNPAFCSTLLWQAALGVAEIENPYRSSLAYIEAFLILPLALHQTTRTLLPARITTSMPVWISRNPLAIASLPARTKALALHAKEALIFGASGGLFHIEGEYVYPKIDKMSDVKAMLRRTSAEVIECNKKAQFLGKWFACTGTPETIFALLGIRP